MKTAVTVVFLGWLAIQASRGAHFITENTYTEEYRCSTTACPGSSR